jgi:phage pi2 protein 07
MAQQSEVQAIYEVSKEIVQSKEALKQFKLDFEEKLSELDSYDEVEEAKSVLKVAKLKLKHEMENSGTVVAAKENLEKMRSDLRDLKEVLSLHLLRHYTDTGTEHVPLETSPDWSQEIIVKAKLGQVVVPE